MKLKHLFILSILFFSESLVSAQVQDAQNGLQSISNKFSFGGFFAAAAGAILGIGLLTAVWSIANNKQNAKEKAIGWFIGLIFYLIFML